MAKKYILEFTEAQLRALMEMTDTISGMIGVGSDFDYEATKQVRLIDRVLKKVGIERDFK